jgi:hypothetical protein
MSSIGEEIEALGAEVPTGSAGGESSTRHGMVGWSRRSRLLWAFIVGPLIVLAGVYYLLSEGLTFTTVWFLAIGGLLLAFGFRDLLMQLPTRKPEDAILVLARPSTLVISLLVGGLTFIIVTVSSYMSWPDNALRFAVYAVFFLLLFAYARRWKNRHVTGSSGQVR